MILVLIEIQQLQLHNKTILVGILRTLLTNSFSKDTIRAVIGFKRISDA